MEEITTVGLDLAKNVFQFHGSDSTARVVLRKKLQREQLLPFFAKQPGLYGGDGSVFQQSSLGPGDWRSGAYSSIDPARLCEAICEASEE